MLARAWVSLDRDIIAHPHEDGFRGLERLGLAADHDDETCLACADVATRHGCVQCLEAAGCRLGRNAAREHRARRRHVDEQRAGPRTGDDLAMPQIYVFDVAWKAEHGEI